MAAKRCLICTSSFSGRRDAKTCSARCRKRLQIVRAEFISSSGVGSGVSASIEKEVHHKPRALEESSHKREGPKGSPWQKGLRAFIGFAIGLGFLLHGFFATSPATAATSSYLNFQSRLLTNTGSVVADGNYNIEFKITNDPSSSDGGTGACSGSCLWRETRQNSNSQGVRVVNGYLSVNLGSVNSFPSTINWDQQLYLTMNIGGTSTGASPTYDNEMSPRISLTALPYAFRAGAVAKTDGSGNVGTLSFSTVANNPNLTLPDVASGTVLVSTTGVQLQGTSPGTQQTGHFNISGTGIVGTSLLTPSITTTTAAALGIANSTATAVNIGNTSSNITTTVTGLAVFKPSTGNDSTTAFQVQNAIGSNALSVDTTPINTILSNTSFENTDVSAWVYLGTPGSVARDTTQQYFGNASLKVITTANTSNGVKYVTGASGLAISTTYTISWYDKLDSGSAALADIRAVYARNGSAEVACTGINSQTVISTAWTRHTCQIVTDGTTPASTAYIAIEQTAGAIHTFYIDGVQIEAASSATQYKETGINLQGLVTSNTGFSGLLTVQPASSLVAGQTNITQNFTNASSTGGTVNGYSQTITVNNTSSASTTNGMSISLADNTALANTNRGINIALSGSNPNQLQIGADIAVSTGTGLRVATSGSSGLVACGTTSFAGLAICADGGANSPAIYGTTTSDGSQITSVPGTGITGNNASAGSAGQFYKGVVGRSIQNAAAAYTSIGVYGKADGGAGATTYGGYFQLGANGATAGAALYASNSTAAANILQLQDDTTDVLTVADGGAATFKNSSNSATAFQIQNAGGNELLTVDTSAKQRSTR
jgi:hypothetical protein